MMSTPDEKFYRSTLRTRMKAWRRTVSPDTHAELSRRICDTLEAYFHPPPSPFAFYYPIAKEPDISPLMHEWYAAGVQVCLPRVVTPGAPLEFYLWQAHVRLTMDEAGIYAPPADPATRVIPKQIFIPCLGLDKAGFRLGYGGAYYDRTLPLLPDITTLGVLFSGQQLDDIRPQDHDIPLDGWVTEKGVWLSGRNETLRR
jgi:5,10-methenyltetrahydrofolate synthetase